MPEVLSHCLIEATRGLISADNNGDKGHVICSFYWDPKTPLLQKPTALNKYTLTKPQLDTYTLKQNRKLWLVVLAHTRFSLLMCNRITLSVLMSTASQSSCPNNTNIILIPKCTKP